MKEVATVNRVSDGKPYENLAYTIIVRAADDYREAYEIGDTYTLKEVERFFKSDWIQALTTLDGKELFGRLKDECERLFESGKNY